MEQMRGKDHASPIVAFSQAAESSGLALQPDAPPDVTQLPLTSVATALRRLSAPERPRAWRSGRGHRVGSLAGDVVRRRHTEDRHELLCQRIEDGDGQAGQGLEDAREGAEAFAAEDHGG